MSLTVSVIHSCFILYEKSVITLHSAVNDSDYRSSLILSQPPVQFKKKKKGSYFILEMIYGANTAAAAAAVLYFKI